MKSIFAVCIAVAAIVAVTGCSHKSTGGTTGALASSTAVSQAEARAQAQVTTCLNSNGGVTGLISSSGRTKFFDCVKAIAAPAKQDQLKNCLLSAAARDQLWLSSGRTNFETKDAPGCLVNAA